MATLLLNYALLAPPRAKTSKTAVIAEVQQLVAQLGHSEYIAREKAMRKLTKIGVIAIPILCNALDSQLAEVRLRAAWCLRTIGSKGHTSLNRILRHSTASMNSGGKKRLRNLQENMLITFVRRAGGRVKQYGGGDGLSVEFEARRTTKKSIDACLASLSKVSMVKQILLHKTPVDDTSMGFISEIRALEYLEISNTRTTDKGIGKLAGLVNLRAIILRNTAVTDVGVARLQLIRMKKLVLLDFENTGVSQGTMRILAKCKSLVRITVRGCQLSTSAVVRLRKALPRCTVIE